MPLPFVRLALAFLFSVKQKIARTLLVIACLVLALKGFQKGNSLCTPLLALPIA